LRGESSLRGRSQRDRGQGARSWAASPRTGSASQRRGRGSCREIAGDHGRSREITDRHRLQPGGKQRNSMCLWALCLRAPVARPLWGHPPRTRPGIDRAPESAMHRSCPSIVMRRSLASPWTGSPRRGGLGRSPSVPWMPRAPRPAPLQRHGSSAAAGLFTDLSPVRPRRRDDKIAGTHRIQVGVGRCNGLSGQLLCARRVGGCPRHRRVRWMHGRDLARDLAPSGYGDGARQDRRTRLVAPVDDACEPCPIPPPATPHRRDLHVGLPPRGSPSSREAWLGPRRGRARSSGREWWTLASLTPRRRCRCLAGPQGPRWLRQSGRCPHFVEAPPVRYRGGLAHG
jgi:hypothetical protein